MEDKKFDVIVVGGGDYYGHLRRGKSRLIDMIKSDPRYNVMFITPDDIKHERVLKPDEMWFDEMTCTSILTEPVIAEPLRQKPKPYWRKGERW